MRQSSKRVLAWTIIPWSVVACGLLFPQRTAALLIPYNFASLVEKSKYIVTGEVVNIRAYWAPFHGVGQVIHSDVTLRIARVLKGAGAEVREEKELTIQILGGQVGEARQICLESAEYELGEKVLVFVREYNGKLWNTGWLQGKFKLTFDSSTVRGGLTLPITRDLPLSTVENLVHYYLQPSRRGGSE